MTGALRRLAAPRLRVLKVSGNSLWPEYQDGDFVVTLKIPIIFDTWRPGDILAFQRAGLGLLIKKLDHQQAENGGLFMVGSVIESTDSRQFGAIAPDCVIGKVIGHIRRPRPS